MVLYDFRCLSKPGRAKGLIYLTFMGDIFRLNKLERLGSKAGGAEDDPDSGRTRGEHVRNYG